MINILKLNEISPKVKSILPEQSYTVGSDVPNPQAILLRSFSMHEYEVPATVQAVARAGAGVNNIPISKMTEKGICVFNTPGANANAVKELVIAGMLLGSRKIVQGINWTQSLKGDDVDKQVEKGKKAFVGQEIQGKTLGVVGLGAIGRLVANIAIELGMTVLGYDPYLSVDGALMLDKNVVHITDVNQLFAEADYVTLHVPATEQTKNMINEQSIKTMKTGVVILNFARGELVNNADVVEAVKNGKIGRYVTDLPKAELLGIDNIITIPHLGASTPEAEDNCAVMAARQLKDFLENGNVVNSVNFPAASAPRTGVCRISILHKNVANMIATATSFIAKKGINIANLVSASKGEIGYMLLDVDAAVDEETIKQMQAQEGFIKVRVFD